MCCTRIMADATTTQAEEMTEEEAALLKRLSGKFAGAAMTCMFINARGKKDAVMKLTVFYEYGVKSSWVPPGLSTLHVY